MERNEVLNTVSELLGGIIDNENLMLTEESAPSNVEDWDSLAHFNLVMELQNEYGVKFAAAEIQGWKSVADIIDSILSKV